MVRTPRRWSPIAFALALSFALVAPLPAQQFFRGAVGVYSGGIFFSEFNDGAVTDTELTLEPGFVTGMQAEYWFNPRFALRMNGFYTERPFELEREGGFRDFGDSDLFDGLFGDVNVWAADMTGILRILSPKGSSRFAPFVTAGAGLVHYNPAGSERFIPEARVRFGEETRFAAVGGVGVDIIPNTPTKSFGAFIRMELVDHYVFDSPAQSLATLAGDEDDLGGVHNLRLNLGMNVIFGIEPAPMTTAMAPVAPAPVAPAPPPAPAERPIRVCVVQGQTLAEVEARLVSQTGDTVVVRNGMRRPFREAYPGTTGYAAGTPLLAQNEPVRIMDREFVRSGGTRIIPAPQLQRVSEVQGVGVFAEAGAAAPYPVVYVPVRPGCEFQPFEAQEIRVRK